MHRIKKIILLLGVMFIMSKNIIVYGAHPCVYYTPDSIQKARNNIAKYQWAMDVFNSLKEETKFWLQRKDEWIREMRPAPINDSDLPDDTGVNNSQWKLHETIGTIMSTYSPNAILYDSSLSSKLPPRFAYGAIYVVCPVCGKKWNNFGYNNVCDFTRPNTIRCPHCGTIFPNARYFDKGGGCNPGTTNPFYWYYFIGEWNSYVILQFCSAAEKLAYMYAITDDERYAHKAAVILDTISSIYPFCIRGSEDLSFTVYGDSSRLNSGRMERNAYMAGRDFVKFANAYDLIYNSGELDKPSYYSPTHTIKSFVLTNLIMNGGEWCYNRLMTGLNGLGNGAMDLARAVLAAGILTQKDIWIEEALMGGYSFNSCLANNIDRNGLYFETSVHYSSWTLKLYFELAEMARYLGYNHPTLGTGYNFYDNIKFQQMILNVIGSRYCVGLVPPFGDAGNPATINEDGKVLWDDVWQIDFVSTEALYFNTTNPIIQQKAAIKLYKTTEGRLEEACKQRLATDFLYPDLWNLFNYQEINFGDMGISENDDDVILTQAGQIIFKQGAGRYKRAILFRYGPSFVHGHADTLNINLFAFGREFTHDLGYSVKTAANNRFFSHLATSHELVVLGEPANAGNLNLTADNCTVGQSMNGVFGGTLDGGGGPGGSLQFLYYDDIFKIAEAGCGFINKCCDYCVHPNFNNTPVGNDPLRFADYYRRTISMIKIDDKNSYYLDIFRVRYNGNQYTSDWFFHALGENIKTDLPLSGELPGSLADPNDSSKDWAKLLNESGEAVGAPNAGRSYNGYEYLHKVRRCFYNDKFYVTYIPADDKLNAKLKVTMLPSLSMAQNREVDIAKGYPVNRAVVPYELSFIRVRETGTDGREFVAIYEPYSFAENIKDVNYFDLSPEDDWLEFKSKGVKVELKDGKVDYHMFSVLENTVRSNKEEEIKFEGKYGFIRVDNNKIYMKLAYGKKLKKGDIGIESKAIKYAGTITNIFPESDEVEVKLSTTYTNPLPVGNYLSGHYIIFVGANYTHNSVYTIKSIRRIGNLYKIKLNQTFIVGKVKADGDYGPSASSIPNKLPLQMSRSCQYQFNHYFDGKRIKNLSNNQIRIISEVNKEGGSTDMKTIYLTTADATGNNNDDLEIYDIYIGDTFIIPVSTTLSKKEKNIYNVHLEMDTKVTLPTDVEKSANYTLAYKNKDGKYVEANNINKSLKYLEGDIFLKDLDSCDTIVKVVPRVVSINGNTVNINFDDMASPTIEKIIVNNKKQPIKENLEIQNISKDINVELYVKDELNPINFQATQIELNGREYTYNDFDTMYRYLREDGKEGILKIRFIALDKDISQIRIKISDYSPNENSIIQTFLIENFKEFGIKKVFNYPNPFSKKTYIVYILNNIAIDVKIKIYTINGRLVKEIKNLPGEIGQNEIEWDGKDYKNKKCANGVYIYKIIAKSIDDKIAEKKGKIVIMR